MSESETVFKSRRAGVVRHMSNPFLSAVAENTRVGTKRITNKAGDKCMIVSEATGEILAPAGFHEVIEVDRTQFVKLYINGVKAFQGLKAAGAKMFEVLYRTIQERPGQDRVYMHYHTIDQAITPISRATFDRGMNELLDKKFIAEALEPSMYYVNADYMYNGNRLAFIKEYRLAGTRAADIDPSESLTNLET